MQQAESLTFSLPEWLQRYVADTEVIASVQGRMSFVIEAARRNVINRTGGPFAAAVFEKESGKLISLGVNLVTTENLSTLHAEMVALMLAQRALGSYDLGSPDLPEHELVTSTEPCAMCLGAIPWSGVVRVITGATDADARAIGFDEGAKMSQWREALQERRIEVITEIKREAARDVLKTYVENGGHLYNSREV